MYETINLQQVLLCDFNSSQKDPPSTRIVFFIFNFCWPSISEHQPLDITPGHPCWTPWRGSQAPVPSWSFRGLVDLGPCDDQAALRLQLRSQWVALVTHCPLRGTSTSWTWESSKDSRGTRGCTSLWWAKVEGPWMVKSPSSGSKMRLSDQTWSYSSLDARERNLFSLPYQP